MGRDRLILRQPETRPCAARLSAEHRSGPTAGTATIAPAAPLAGATTYDVRVVALNQQTPGPYTTTSATTPPAPTN